SGRPRLPPTMSPSSDEHRHDDVEIIGLIIRGNMKEALRRLMQRYGTQIYRYCRTQLRDSSLADDVHQQVFIDAYRELPKFNRRSSIRTWLFAIARHRVLDDAKSRRRAQTRRETLAVADPSPSPGERIDDARLLEALHHCLGELRGSIRTALLLRFQHGFTFEDMAEVCREKPGTL